MAAGVPLIGSIIGGTPVLVRNGENGLIFPAGDAEALKVVLRKLLESPELRHRMGDAGYTRAHSELDEKTYVREFARMIEATVSDAGQPEAEAQLQER
jgi:glycosyltransferase involved in cell wall biosynthesis